MKRFPDAFRTVVSTGLFAICLATGCSSSVSNRCRFDPAEFQDHVEYLAADDRQGRGLGTEGIEAAAEYIADEFERIGLSPAGENGTFFQSLKVKLDPELGDDSKLSIDGLDYAPVAGRDYVPFPFSSSAEFDGDLVFAGYGITNEDEGYDDYVHLDVAGKVVLMLRREPPGWADEDDDVTPFAQFSSKIYTARENGAAAVLIVNQRPKEGEADELIAFHGHSGGGVTADMGLPAFHVSRVLADRMLAAAGSESLAALQEKIDGGGFASAELEGMRMSGRADVRRREKNTRNVAGILYGDGDGVLAREVLVIGAHYDHLGVTVPRTSFARRKTPRSDVPEIHNGADDNASGTAGMIELARALSTYGPRPRSVLFIAFTGEESGLLGSKYYVDHPTVPLDDIVAMINLDMIGRLKDGGDTIQVFGTKAAEGFEEMLDRLADARGLKIRGSASAYGPSDHTSFYAKKIPALHFFTGLHTDYHLPSDDADKINANGAVRTLELVADVACEIIARDERPIYNRVAAPKAEVGKSRFRVRMGIMPGYADSEDGMAVDGVIEDGPAEKAGMLDGDIIVRIAGKQVKNVYDYMAALATCKPDDVVKVVVVREGKELTLEVTLAGG